MSKYIVMIPVEQIERMELYVNRKRRKLEDIKAETGADYLVNGGLFNGDWTPCPWLKVDGAVLASATWGAWGYAWNAGDDITMLNTAAKMRNFISCVPLLTPWDGPQAKLTYPADMGGSRPRTAVGMRGKELILYCSNAGDSKTPEALRDELYKMGCDTAVMLDGGGSSQCDFSGQKISSSRVVHNYIAVYLKKKEDKPMSKKYKVCLDPGHGPDTVNGSPDGTYKEKEFTWDMYTRLRPLLEQQGIEVVVTRRQDNKPSLTERATVSNRAGADLFVSLHSNAAGNGGWYDGAHGLLAYTSAPPKTAPRNVVAKAILARMREAGVSISGSGLLHKMEYTVLTKTSAPAVLIEYGFHTNQADVELLKDSGYRDKLAEATAKGICDSLGVPWTAGATPAAPWYAPAQKFVMGNGISDGTRPNDTCTRAEVWEMIYKADKNKVGG